MNLIHTDMQRMMIEALALFVSFIIAGCYFERWCGRRQAKRMQNVRRLGPIRPKPDSRDSLAKHRATLGQ